MKRTNIFFNIKSIALYVAFCVFALNASAKVVPTGFAELVEPLFPAVVNISTTKKKTKQTYKNRAPKPFPEGPSFEDFKQFFERFADPQNEMEDDSEAARKHFYLGSGFIIDPDGFIVTNKFFSNRLIFQERLFY